MSARKTLALVAAAAAALALSACGTAIEGPVHVTGSGVVDDDGLHAIVLPKPYRVSDASLTDTAGRPATVVGEAALDSPRRALTLVYVGYTNCKDVCPTTMGNIAAALARIPAADRAKVGLVFVTSDPRRDDAKTLRTWLDRYDPESEGLTGTLDHLVQVGDSIGVEIENGAKLSSGGYDVTHGDKLTGVLPDGTAPLVWNGGFSSKELADDLESVLAHGVPELGSRS